MSIFKVRVGTLHAAIELQSLAVLKLCVVGVHGEGLVVGSRLDVDLAEDVQHFLHHLSHLLELGAVFEAKFLASSDLGFCLRDDNSVRLGEVREEFKHDFELLVDVPVEFEADFLMPFDGYMVFEGLS